MKKNILSCLTFNTVCVTKKKSSQLMAIFIFNLISRIVHNKMWRKKEKNVYSNVPLFEFTNSNNPLLIFSEMCLLESRCIHQTSKAIFNCCLLVTYLLKRSKSPGKFASVGLFITQIIFYLLIEPAIWQPLLFTTSCHVRENDARIHTCK